MSREGASRRATAAGRNQAARALKRQRRTQEERSEATRARLVDATIEVVFEKGYAGCTVQEVCRRAGVTTGALQHHFRSKQELLVAAVNKLFPQVVIPAVTEQGVKKPVRKRCDEIIETYWQIYSNPRYKVVWDIVLGARSDPKLYGLVCRYQREATVRNLEVFEAAFDDVPLARKDLVDLAQFAMCEMRGIALLGIFGAHLDERRGQIDLLRRCLCDRIEGALGAAAANPKSDPTARAKAG
jgi:AcrR family transcriptional regulator